MGAMISRWFGLTDVRLLPRHGIDVSVGGEGSCADLVQGALSIPTDALGPRSSRGELFQSLWVFLYGMRAGALGLGIANLVSVMLGLCCSGWLILKGWRHCPATSIQQILCSSRTFTTAWKMGICVEALER